MGCLDIDMCYIKINDQAITEQGICLMRYATFFALLFTLILSYATTLTVGVPETDPPFIMASSVNQFVGFDAEFMSEVCRRISAKCIFKPLNYGQIFNAIESGSIDLAIGSLTKTPSRERSFLFTSTYMPSYAQYLINKGSSIHSVDDLLGKTFGIANTSIYADMVISKFGDRVKIKYYKFHRGMLSALQNGDVDVLLMDKATTDYWIANTDNQYLQLGAPIQYGSGYGIIVNKNEVPLVSMINNAVTAMRKDGTYQRIYSTYFSQ